MPEPIPVQADTLQESGVYLVSGKEQRDRENGKLVKQVFCDAYNFYLKYHGCSMEPGNWRDATNDFAEIMRKCGGEPICGRIMLATFAQLERETDEKAKE